MRGNLRQFGVFGASEARREEFLAEGCLIALLLLDGCSWLLEAAERVFGELLGPMGVSEKVFSRNLAVVRAVRPGGMKRLAAVGKGVR